MLCTHYLQPKIPSAGQVSFQEDYYAFSVHKPLPDLTEGKVCVCVCVCVCHMFLLVWRVCCMLVCGAWGMSKWCTRV